MITIGVRDTGACSMTYPLKVKVTKCRANRLVVLTGSIVVTVMLEDGYGEWVTRERYSIKCLLISRVMRG